jgi:SAM-dependent methyltransferase
MPEQPYHKYVFDTKKRKFVGKFEEMYQKEDKGNYDSWFQGDLTHLGRQISFTVLDRYNFTFILDIGCGKGCFTHLLKKNNNKVIGVDISETAITKAKSKYNTVEFLALKAEDALKLPNRYDLIIMMEIISYLKNWRKILAVAAEKTSYLYISLYLPPNPIGFVKSFGQLKREIEKYFAIETELLWNNETILILGKRKNNKLGE